MRYVKIQHNVLFILHINYILAVWSAIIKHFHKRSCDESGIRASKAFC